MFETEKRIPLDLFVGLLAEESRHFAVYIPGIYELEFVNNYHRVPTSQMDWFTPDNIVMYNAGDLLFPLAEYDWGMITHFGLWLSKEASDCIYVGELRQIKTILKGNHVNFRPKTINILIENLEEYEHYKFGGEQYNG